MPVQQTRRKVNAPRKKWPTMFDPNTGLFTPEYEAYTREMSICYDLVNIAKEILNKPLRLRAGGPRDGIIRAATDGTNIFLPKMHPNRLVAIKHELSHIYFESDIPLRLQFVKGLIAKLEKQSKERLASMTREKLIEDLCFFINILDDVRVNSLWGLLYPGDGLKMEQWYFEKVGPEMAKRAEEDYPDGDIDHLFTYAILLCIHQDAKSTKWERFRTDIEDARDRVHYKSFDAMLVIVRGLVEKIAKEIAEKDDKEKQPPPKDQSPDPDASDENGDSEESTGGGASENDEGEEKEEPNLAQALAEMENAKRPGDDFDYDNAGFDHKKMPKQTKNPRKLEEQIQAVQKILDIDLSDTEEVEQELDDAEAEQLAKVQDLQQKMAHVIKKQMEDDDYDVKRKVKAELRFTDVRRADIVPVDMSPEEREAAQNWRRHFQKVMGAMRRRVSPVGYELVTPLYISQKINNQPLVCYRRPMTGRGFRLRVLVDLSGSMWGNKWDQVQRLYRVLEYALDFPFVDLDVMGFYSEEKGVVNIVRYQKGVKGLMSAKSKPGGITPLSHAIQVAGQDLIGKKHNCFLFVLSDGNPVYRLKNSVDKGRRAFVNKNMLVNWTTDAVRELQKHRVQTYCFMIGHAHGYDIPKEEELDRMFGHAFWQKVEEESLFRDSFGFIRDQFLRYLRSR